MPIFPEALAELDMVCCSRMPGIDTVKLRKVALALARGAVGYSILARISSTHYKKAPLLE